ncbi:MAG: rhodanese-like domain-containing protein [Alphaproteobacteria bacterium]
MLKKGFKELLAEANAAVESISAAEARQLLEAGGAVFVDVREGSEHAEGHIPSSVSVPRGFLEFIADPTAPMHNPALSSGKRLVLYCASGGRSALAAKTLADMGIANVCHMAGGFGAWVQAGGPVNRRA